MLSQRGPRPAGVPAAPTSGAATPEDEEQCRASLGRRAQPWGGDASQGGGRPILGEHSGSSCGAGWSTRGNATRDGWAAQGKKHREGIHILPGAQSVWLGSRPQKVPPSQSGPASLHRCVVSSQSAAVARTATADGAGSAAALQRDDMGRKGSAARQQAARAMHSGGVQGKGQSSQIKRHRLRPSQMRSRSMQTEKE